MLQSSCREPRGSLAHWMPAPAIALVVAAFVSGCAERDSPAMAEASRPSGQQFFVNYCASCHGLEGRGDGPLASELRVAPANLRLLAQQNDGSFPTRRIQTAIDGRGMPLVHGLPDMPVWGTVWKREGLSEAEVRAQTLSVASYIRSLQD